MPSYNITFKPNPDSVQIGTGSYTIPVGYFGFVSAVQGASDFEIDGNLILKSTSLTAVLYNNAGGGGYTVPANQFFEGQFYSSGINDLRIDSNLIATTGAGGTGATPIQFKAGPNHVLFFPSVTGNITGYTRAQTESPFSTWIPEGTMVDGGRWVVSLFFQ